MDSGGRRWTLGLDSGGRRWTLGLDSGGRRWTLGLDSGERRLTAADSASHPPCTEPPRSARYRLHISRPQSPRTVLSHPQSPSTAISNPQPPRLAISRPQLLPILPRAVQSCRVVRPAADRHERKWARQRAECRPGPSGTDAGIAYGWGGDGGSTIVAHNVSDRPVVLLPLGACQHAHWLSVKPGAAPPGPGRAGRPAGPLRFLSRAALFTN